MDRNKKMDKSPNQEKKLNPYRMGDEVQLGDLVAIGINSDAIMKLPFLIVKVSELGPKDKAVMIDGVKYRSLKGRIFGNTTCNKSGIYRNGWLQRLQNKHYFTKHALHRSHEPFMLENYLQETTTYNVVLAGFDFNDKGSLDRTVLEALERSPYITWGTEDEG
jgi:hypothetical protein